MSKSYIFCVFFLAILILTEVSGISNSYKTDPFIIISQQDTLKRNQILYSGRDWVNKYHRIIGDQFLFSNLFLSGNVSINSQVFKNIRIRYDIYSDEISTPLNREEIVQLNKESTDSFTLIFENKDYRFINLRIDTLKGFTGYLNVLYSKKSALYVKFIKTISPNVTQQSDGEFLQKHKIYLIKKNVVFLIGSKKDLFEAFKEDIIQIKSYIKDNKIKISVKNPESIIPVIRYYDTLMQ
jgi:hypothetical protein